MKVSDLFVQCLEAHGVKYLFGVPGEENLDILESLRNSSIELIVTRNEQTAVFMAATYGRLTGKTGVAMATLGPGATNMMTGVAYAQLGGMPVIVITGQKPIKKSKQGQFQVIDVVSMMKPVTKFSHSIVDGARVASTLAQAFSVAESEKPGAVHIELAEDIAGEEVSDSYQPIVYEKIRRAVPDKKAIGSLAQKISQSTMPMILIGAGANRKRVRKHLNKLIRHYNIPFFCSQMGKGVVDERLPQYLGTAALTSNDLIHPLIEQSDLILAIGYDTAEKPTTIVSEGKTEIIHINFFPAAFDETYKPSLQIIGDIGNTLWQLSELSFDTHGWNFEKLYHEKEKANAIMHSNSDHFQSQFEFMTPGILIRSLRELMGEEDIVALDNGLYKVWFARNYPCYQPNTLLLDNALATMGAGYSSAMMAKILMPEKKVVAVVGDGGLMMNLGDLETAIKLKLDMTIVILNDNAYGMIKRKQAHHGMKDFGLDLQNPDFVKLAEAFGASGYRVEDPKDFVGSMQQAMEQKGLSIVEVLFSYPEEIA